MKISIIIVSFNVKHFLRQCLNSVISALDSIPSEIICIDNHSIDGSAEMIKNDFQMVHLVQNQKNQGFAKACNQGIEMAQGEYILILNPDTVLEKNSIKLPLNFMDDHTEAGAVGVKMMDGNGRFLPESKRGLPTPSAAFFKMSGLSRLFYPSRFFGKYYLDHLDREEIHPVHILTGAYMLIRKSVLEQVGSFDESFFMYGEDIDLSHRIVQAGYVNYYYPKTSIIHYKGESTSKESLRYVINFYNAMLIFSKKHFSGEKTKALSLLIKAAIIFRAFLSLTKRIAGFVFIPFADFVILLTGLVFISKFWAREFIYPEGGNYPEVLYQLILPIYAVIWVFSIYLTQGYKHPFKYKTILLAIIGGSFAILTLYSLLNETWRFSRAIILLGGIWGLFSLTGYRWIFNQLAFLRNRFKSSSRVLIIGNLDEAERIKKIVQHTKNSPDYCAFVSPDINKIDYKNYIGSIDKLNELLKIYDIDEIIFCAKDMNYHQIIKLLTQLSAKKIRCKIAPENSYSIIGSNSISSLEDLYLHELKSIVSTDNQRNKRVFDFLFAIVLLASFPLTLFAVPKPWGFVKNIFWVLFNKKSWIGFDQSDPNINLLPRIKIGVLTVTDGIKDFDQNPEIVVELNVRYAKDYDLKQDLNILFTGFKKLGRQ